MVPELILFALLVGWLAGGKFFRLADAKIRHAWLVFVPFALYLVSWAPPLMKLSWYGGVTNVFERIVLVFLTIVNRRFPGAVLITFGLLLNLTAIVANEGVMPARPESIALAFGEGYLQTAQSGHQMRNALMDTTSELGFLCDVIGARRPFVLVPAVYSVGDLVMSVGIFISIIALMRTPLPSEGRGETKEAELAGRLE